MSDVRVTSEPLGTLSPAQAAKRMGLSARTVQKMVDLGHLRGFRTPGGHRRIYRSSLAAWATKLQCGISPLQTPVAVKPFTVLLVEDSCHYQKLIGPIITRELPEAELHIVPNGTAGMALARLLQPRVLLVDVTLPSNDGIELIAHVRSAPRFARSSLIVVTGLEKGQLAPHASTLAGLPVVRRATLAADLPTLLAVTYRLGGPVSPASQPSGTSAWS
jgi:excisionase family DNA binding protein